MTNNTISQATGYSANYKQSTPSIISGYDRSLNTTPMDTYELESLISKDQPEVEANKHNWFTDSWNNFNNKRDEIRLMTERAKIVNEISPELDNIEKRMAQSDITEEELTKLQERYKTLQDEKQEVFNNINEIEQEVNERKKSGVSAYYQAKEQIAQDKSLLDIDYWKYSVPGTMGSSFSDMSSYLAGAGAKMLSFTTTAIGTAVAGAGAIPSGGASIAVGAAIKTAGDVGATALSLYGVNKANRSEALAETYGAYKDKVIQTFKQNGSDVYDYIKGLKSNDPNLSIFTDEQVLDKLLTGEIEPDSEDVKTILNESKKGLSAVYDRNRALIYSDLAQNILTGMNVGKIGSLSRKFLKATKLNKVVDPIRNKYDKILDGITGWQTRVAMESPAKGAAISISKKLAKYGLAAIGEGFEEGSQNVFNRDFLKGVYDDGNSGILKAYSDYISANWRVGKILAGIDTESELANDPNFYNEVKGGIALGLLMGGLGSVPSVTVGTARELAANRFVRDLTLDSISKKEKMAKIEAYSDELSKRFDNSENIIKTFEDYKKYILPKQEDSEVTEEDIDDEIELFKQVRNTVNNKEFNAMAKAAGFDRKSKEYNTFVGLSIMSKEQYDEAQALNNETYSKLKELEGKITQDKAFDQFNNDDKLTRHNATEISIANSKLHVLNSIIEDIESEAEDKKTKWGVLNKNNPIGKLLLNRAKTYKKSLEEYIDTLSNGDESFRNIELSSNDTLEMQKAYFSSLLAEASADNAMLVKDAYEGNIRNSRGLPIPFRKLNKEDKNDIINAIKDRVQNYLNNLNHTTEVIQKNAKDFLSNEQNQPESKPTTVPSPQPPTQPKSSVDASINIPKEDDTADEKEGTNVENNTDLQYADIEDNDGEDLVNDIQAALANEEEQTTDVLDIEDADEEGGIQLEDATNNVEITIEDGTVDSSSDVTIEEKENDNITVEESADQPGVDTQVDQLDETDTVDEADINKERELTDGLFGNKQLSNLESANDKVSSTLFYSPTATKPMLPGYKSGSELQELLNKKNVLSECSLRFFINTSYNIINRLSDLAKGTSIVFSSTEKYTYLRSLSSTNDLSNYTSYFKIPNFLKIKRKSFEGKILGFNEIKVDNNTGKIVAKVVSELDNGTKHTVDNIEIEYIPGSDDYVAGNKDTYDNAAVLLEISHPSGLYLMSLATPNKAASMPGVDEDAINRLKANRNSIIEALENASPDTEIVPVGIQYGNGKYDVLRKTEDGVEVSIQRNLSDNKGMDIPSNYHEINKDNVTIGIGSGYKGTIKFAIISSDGQPLPGTGNSGGCYYIAKPSQTFSGKQLPIQLNVVRFNKLDKFIDIDSLLDAFFNHTWDTNEYLSVNNETTDITFESIFNFVFDFRNREEDQSFLIEKQFFYDKNGNLVVGNNTYDPNNIDDNTAKSIKDYIKNNFHWSVSRKTFWGTMSDALPEIDSYFDDNQQVNEINLFGIKFKREDFDGKTTVMGWMIGNGLITTDASDNLFKDPFVYYSGISAVDNNGLSPKTTETTVGINESSSSSTTIADNTDTVITESDTKVEDEFLKKASEGIDPLNDMFGATRTIDDLPEGIKPVEASNPVTQDEINWLKDNLGLDPEISDEVAAIIGKNQYIMGICKLDSIVLYRSAIKGTVYHEAFHRVSLLLQKPSERRTLYELYRRRYNLEGDDNAIEEALAEDFREYMQNTMDPELNIVRRLFNKIKYFVKTWFNKSDRYIYNLFKQISYGKFKNIPINKESEQEFINRYKNIGGAPFKYHGIEINSISNTQIEETVKTLASVALITNNVRFSGDLVNLDLSKVKAALNPSISEALLKNGRLTPEQAAARNEIFEKFDTFAELIKEELRKYKISIYNTEESIEEDSNNKESGDYDGAGLAAHTKSSLEISSKSNALPAVKMFIACLKNQKYNDKGELYTVTNPATGMVTTVDFDSSWKVISNELAECETIKDMIDKSVRLGKDIALFKTLAEALNDLTVIKDSDNYQTKLAKENLSTQIRNTFRKNKADLIFLNVKNSVDENGDTQVEIVINNESANKGIIDTTAGWVNNLIETQEIISVTPDGYTVNTEKINSVKTKYQSLVNAAKKGAINNSNLNTYKKNFISCLNDLGIQIDIETLNTVLNDPSFYDPSSIVSFSKLLTSANNDASSFLFNNKLNDLTKIDKDGNIRSGNFKIKLKEFYNRTPFVNKLAQAYLINNPSPEETSVLSTNNKLLYTITEHNYLSDYTLELNTNEDAVNKLANVAYVAGVNNNKGKIKGSYILNKLRSGGKLVVQTIVGFKNSTSDDAGRKYTEISPLENYVMKIALTRANRVLLPTMGDSVRYDVLSGTAVEGFSFKNALNIDLKNNRITFDQAVLNRFINYFTTELETILFNYEHQPTKPEDIIKNYDTGNRNGYRLRYFDGIGGLLDSNKTINEALAEFESTDDNNYSAATELIRSILDTWNKKSNVEKHEIMNSYLMDSFKEELNYASSIGLIKWDGKKLSSVQNVAIPSSYINSSSIKYNKYGDDLKNSLSSLEIMMAYFSNSVSSIIEFGKIYTKDPAYYKNPVDMIKRLREVLSTGVTPRTDYESYPAMNDLKEFTVGTLADNEIVSRQFDDIKKSAARSYAFNLLQQSGLTEQEALNQLDNNTVDPSIMDQANAMADTRFKGYSNLNQTDATVLLSPEGYKQLVRRINGWTPDVEKAFNVLNDAKILTDRNSKLYHDSLNTVIQPLKCMFFGERDNIELKRSVPIFDKMAMFPVFPVFATGDIKYVYERMVREDNPIHMLAFESAVKVGQDQKTKIYNKDGSINIDGLSNIVTHKQPLNRFRRQMVTDPHESGHEQMFVSQAMKAAMLNIRPNNTYTTPTGESMSGRDLYNNIFDTINKLTDFGRQEIDEEFGVKEDSEGNLTIDKDKVVKSLKAAAEASHMDQNTIDGLTKDAEGKTAPLSGLSSNSWLESKLIGQHNRAIVDVNTPGGMFIQMSSIAYNDLNVRTDGKVRDLKFDNKDGSIECCISINLLKTIIPDYDKKSFIESKEWLIKHGIIGRDTKAGAIGYRIPAQGPSSVAALKIVDVYPENIGDTITLPDEWTALTGSDRIVVRTSII